jgi:hypothetical protein
VAGLHQSSAAIFAARAGSMPVRQICGPAMSDYYRKVRARRIEKRVDRHTNVPEKTPSRWEALKPQLVTMTFGFILTGILGSYFSNRFQNEIRERERVTTERKQDYDLSLKSIEEFNNLLYARRTRAGMLYTALKRNAAKDELAQRKREYDTAFAEWNSRLQTTLFSIRRVTGSDAYSYFESLVETDLRGPFSLIDTCLTDAYDASIGVKSKREYKCDTGRLLKAALDCSYAMSDELFKFVVIGRTETSDGESRTPEASLEISVRCDVSTISVVREPRSAANPSP